jgi:sugar O-acyltransferase (sialic acid O-acetyltransferase NeuD family)
MLAAIHVHEGQHVQVGELLCTLETTKSTTELEAEASGFVVALSAQIGQSVSAGELLCYLAGDPAWKPPEPESSSMEVSTARPAAPPGLRITQPALALARQHNIDLAQLPLDRLVTERLVQAYLQAGETPGVSPTLESTFDPTAIIVYGGGGHGKSLIDLLRALGTYRIVGVLDDGIGAGEKILGVPVLGGSEQLSDLYESGVRQAINAVGGIGNLAVRTRVFQRLAQAGFVCPPVVHPSAFVEPSATLAAGVQIMPLAYVGSEARLGFGVIVNTGAVVSHDCRLGDYANISPGALLAGEVQIGEGALIGMGATVNLLVSVGAGARIGNGSTVKENVPDKGIVRAGMIWPKA